jgi:hypothetical protein
MRFHTRSDTEAAVSGAVEALAMLDGAGEGKADLAAPLFVLTNTAVPFLAEVLADLDPLWVAAAMSVLAGVLAGKGLIPQGSGRN